MKFLEVSNQQQDIPHLVELAPCPVFFPFPFPDQLFRPQKVQQKCAYPFKSPIQFSVGVDELAKLDLVLAVWTFELYFDYGIVFLAVKFFDLNIWVFSVI
jgi:hypothetical protein